MWTRAQVARHLGKSIATVRRMEGLALHPWVDDGGVHRFDPDEVEAVQLRDSEMSHRAARSSWFEGFVDDKPSMAAENAVLPSGEVLRLRVRLATAERKLAHVRHRLAEAQARERALIERDHAIRGAVVDEVNNLIDSLAPSQIGRQNVRKIMDFVRSLRLIDDMASGL